MYVNEKFRSRVQARGLSGSRPLIRRVLQALGASWRLSRTAILGALVASFIPTACARSGRRSAGLHFIGCFARREARSAAFRQRGFHHHLRRRRAAPRPDHFPGGSRAAWPALAVRKPRHVRIRHGASTRQSGLPRRGGQSAGLRPARLHRQPAPDRDGRSIPDAVRHLQRKAVPGLDSQFASRSA